MPVRGISIGPAISGCRRPASNSSWCPPTENSKRGCAGRTSRPATGAKANSRATPSTRTAIYKLGDALKFVDADAPEKGLLFDGRIAEDFKLSTGTWTSVGPLRARFSTTSRLTCATWCSPAPTATISRALVFPDIEACRKLAGLGAEATPAAIVEQRQVRAKFAALLQQLAAPSPGTSTRIERAILMAEPPSMDKSEATDKGSINQRAVLNSRAALVEKLYAEPADAAVIG